MLSYRPDSIGPFRQAADCVDRLLKGEKPADLPVRAPIKYELDINLKTAKALGITIAPPLLARADEAIEYRRHSTWNCYVRAWVACGADGIVKSA